MRQRNRKTFRIILLSLLILSILLIMLSRNLNGMLEDMAHAMAYSMALEAINESVIQVISEGVEYDQLIHVIMDKNGRVAALRSDSIVMSRLATRTALIAEEKLNSLENQTISLPLGSAIGIKFLAGAGPRVNVKIVPVGAVGATFSSTLSTAGINQSLHQVFLNLRATVRLIMPTGSQKVEVAGSLPVAENIIVGLVPDSFVDVGDQMQMLELAP